MRYGLTRTEFAVAAGVCLLAAGLLLPRVQAARADAARVQCADNLRKLGQGFAEFEKAHGGLPPRRAGFNNGEPYDDSSAFGTRLTVPRAPTPNVTPRPRRSSRM